MKGCDTGITPEEAKEDLTYENYQILNTSWMENGIQFMMMSLSITEEAREVSNLTHCRAMSIKIEVKRPHKGLTQFGNCQDFDHVKTACELKPNCVRCAKNHTSASFLTKYPNKIAPICANCRATTWPHTKIDKPTKKKTTENTEETENTNLTQPITNTQLNTTYSDAAKSDSTH